jgi:ankyrin repeat protein
LTKTDDEGFTALDIAIVHGQYDSALILYKTGIDLKSVDFYKTRRDMFTVK